MFIVNRKAIAPDGYRYYVTICGKTNLSVWKRPAQALKITKMFDYVKFLKDNYDVKISLNIRDGKPYGYSIDFKTEADAQALADLSNRSVGLCQT